MKFHAIAVLSCLAIVSVQGQDRCPDPNPLVTGRSYNKTASSEFGQARLSPQTSHNPNYVEGKEFYNPLSLAVDTSSSPHHIYVADTTNNRVLAWKDVGSYTTGSKADLWIGQRDEYSTDPQGPTTDYPSGFTLPVAVAVDLSGNLYVADSGNNRILRFPTPFAQTSQSADLIIGQKALRAVGSQGNGSANEGLSAPSEKTIYLSANGSYFQSGLAFDASGNLWFSDAGNNRVLRYSKDTLAAGGTEPAASVVVGQGSNTTNAKPTQPRYNKTGMLQPTGIALSSSGDLYVADSEARVLYFQAPISNFRVTADRILGMVTPFTSGQTPNGFSAGCPVNGVKDNCDFTLGADQGSGSVVPPSGLAVFNNQLFVADAGNHRVVRYDTPANWAQFPICNFDGTAVCAAGTYISPRPIQYIGQSNVGTSVSANKGQRQPDATTLYEPQGVALDNDGTLYIADTFNNRVLSLPAQNSYGIATRVLGQVDFPYNAVNLAEGRGLYSYGVLTNIGGSTYGSGSVAVDYSSDPPHMYVADMENNRILGFIDARKVRPGTNADIMIGQPNFQSTVRNFGTSDAATPSSTSLASPTGLAVDTSGNLYVADSGNSRVLRFPQPFAQTGTITANLVLGQPGFNTNPANAPALSASGMASGLPYGLALTQNGSLAVSDVANNRVLVFYKCTPFATPCPSGSDFVNGQAAGGIFGQATETGQSSGSDTNQMNAPRGIAIDTSDRLYVADTGNQRLMVFGAGTGAGIFTAGKNSRAFVQGFSTPWSVAVSKLTGEIWLATGQGTIRLPYFEVWSLNPTTATQVISPSDSYTAVVGVALDLYDNPIIAESGQRMAEYYTRASFANAASFLSTSTRPLTPGMIAYACGVGIYMPTATTYNVVPGLPWPTQWSDTQVTVNGVASPIYYVGPDRVAFQVPWETPVDTVAVQVTRVSTGQIIAASSISIDVANPGFFIYETDPSDQWSHPTDQHPIAATNEDGTVNSQANPIGRGHYISLYGTGIGVLNNPPPDGQSATTTTPAMLAPTVLMNPGGTVPAANIQYFGLTVGWGPGVFQLNIKVPDTVANTGAGPWPVFVGVATQGRPSNQSDSGQLLNTIIWVK